MTRDLAGRIVRLLELEDGPLYGGFLELCAGVDPALTRRALRELVAAGRLEVAAGPTYRLVENPPNGGGERSGS